MNTLRLTICCLAVLFLSVAAPPQALSQAPGKREVSALVKEYIGGQASSARLAEITARLREAQRSTLTGALILPSGKAAEVGPAIRLATDLRVPGLFSAARKFIDSDHEDAIVAYGLRLAEKGAAEQVFERWKTLAQDSASWAVAQKHLLQFGLPPTVIFQVKTCLDTLAKDDAKLGPGLSILRFQLGTGEKNHAEILREWPALIAEFDNDTRGFAITGNDLLRPEVCERKGSVLPVSGNWRLNAGGMLVCNATRLWNERAFNVNLRIRPIEGDEIKFIIECESMTWTIQYSDGEWVCAFGDKHKLVIAGKPRAWNEFRIEAKLRTDIPGTSAEVRDGRVCKIMIGGKNLVENGVLNGNMKAMRIQSGSSRCTVGGFNIEFR